MSRWKALSTELDPRVRQLVVSLRRAKDHSGLSMRQLAARTGYSSKSWERYLGGGSLPPAAAVEAIARIGDDDPTRLLALHEVAAEAWGDGRTGAAAPRGRERVRVRVREREPKEFPPEASLWEESLPGESVREEPLPGEPPGEAGSPRDLTAEADPPPGHDDGVPLPVRPLRVALVAGAVTLVLALSSAALVAVRLLDDRGGGAAAQTATVAVSASAPLYVCRPERVGGLWRAGVSQARNIELAYGDTGPDVAEAQCLLRRAGISPGGIDGIFGPLTQRAVRTLQKRSGLVVDGMVGPHTWKALRR
ncbi:peptidoglycan-binding protein [Streptomyces sp. NPDC000658]|uniref:peptidoglycan-binding protein n=1 Tax=Streptomyces sp. NPDC000658 TaxID=3154266 RepID=UPI00331BB75C